MQEVLTVAHIVIPMQSWTTPSPQKLPESLCTLDSFQERLAKVQAEEEVSAEAVSPPAVLYPVSRELGIGTNLTEGIEVI